ncbi:MAG: alanine--tRNA ligase, partial [Propionibacteriaceae bacterium]|nr:alanine--tRNA ligase [Propionibacteriaceae bacterium]
GRGYVLRRLLRRSIRSMRLLGVSDPILTDLLGVSKAHMVSSYPEIEDQWARLTGIATAEEESFTRTLTSGTQIFDQAVTTVKNAGASTLDGDTAFKLHDTYGFPIDLTLEMAEEAGLSVDAEGFKTLMAEQKNRAKADAKLKKGNIVSTAAYSELRKQGESVFLGYTDLTADSRILGLVKNGESATSAGVGEEVEVVLAQTPFYAEAGGQDADTGTLSAAGLTIDVVDVQKPVPGLIVHRGVVTDGLAEVGTNVTAAVDGAARFGSCQAHTATHIVNAALRQLLGPQTHQAGSYNKPGYLRFDFNALHSLSDALKQELEGVANEAIRADWEVTATQMPIDAAKALGAQAMFGEKYGNIVRMVELAGPWSRELCGGTHVATTSKIGLLSLLGEGSVGSGVRRVEALVSTDAFDHLAAERALVSRLTQTLNVQPNQVEERIAKLLTQLKQAEKTIADLKAAQSGALASDLVSKGIDVGSYRFVGAVVDDGSDVRTLANDVRTKLGVVPGVVALVAATPKPTLVVATTGEARSLGAKAGALVGVGASVLGGKGGGRDDLAQGGGSDPTQAEAALKAIAAALV